MVSSKTRLTDTDDLEAILKALKAFPMNGRSDRLADAEVMQTHNWSIGLKIWSYGAWTNPKDKQSLWEPSTW